MEDLMIRNILESMSDSLLIIGPKGEVVYANKATEEILGCDLHDLRLNGLGFTFFTRDENYEFNQIIVDAIYQKAVRSYREVTYTRPDGATRRLASTTSYIVDPTNPDEDFVGFMAIFKDISEVYALRLSEKRLMLERQRVANEKVQSLQKLAAGVAHEIRNPTVVVGGFAARLLKVKELPQAAVDYAGKIMDGARKLESLVAQAQSFCDITAANFQECDVFEVMRKSIEAVSETAQIKNVDIKFRTESPHMSDCFCDPSLLTTAVVHLLRNAVDFSEHGGLVETALDAAGDDFFIEVKDYGVGISDEDLDHIFNPFFSTLPDKSGMGLAVVQRIVNEHMGVITVESRPRCGARFRMTIPKNPRCAMDSRG